MTPTHIPRESPESNGKMERSHWTDAVELCRRVRLLTFEELQAKLRAWKQRNNDLRPHLALKGKTPAGRLCELWITVLHSVQRAA